MHEGARPDVTTTVEGLIEASRTWRPIQARILPAFDFEDFSRTYGLQRRLGAPAPHLHSPDIVDVADAILDILNLDEYRRGPREHLYAEHEQVIAKVASRVQERKQVRIVIPSFPGRPHNPATHRRVRPDMGELYALQRLKNISDHVRHAFEPGVRFIILLDGRAYSPFYGSTPEADHQYPRDLQTMIDRIHAGDSIGLLDLQDLVDARIEEFTTVREGVTQEIEALWRDPNYGFRDELLDSMKIGTDTTAINAAAIQLVKHDAARIDANELVRRMRAAVKERARATAFEYMTFLVTIKRMDLIGRALPDALRGTVHPKPGQYSPYLTDPMTRIAPWHGVAVRFADGTITTVYESVVYQSHHRFRAVYIEGEYEPFFYEEIAHG